MGANPHVRFGQWASCSVIAVTCDHWQPMPHSKCAQALHLAPCHAVIASSALLPLLREPLLSCIVDYLKLLVWQLNVRNNQLEGTIPAWLHTLPQVTLGCGATRSGW